MNIRLANRKLSEAAPDAALYEQVHLDNVAFFAETTGREPFVSAAREISGVGKNCTLVRAYWGRPGTGLESVIKVVHI